MKKILLILTFAIVSLLNAKNYTHDETLTIKRAIVYKIVLLKKHPDLNVKNKKIKPMIDYYRKAFKKEKFTRLDRGIKIALSDYKKYIVDNFLNKPNTKAKATSEIIKINKMLPKNYRAK